MHTSNSETRRRRGSGLATEPVAEAARRRAARGLAEILDSKLFKALCEPTRIAIVKFLTAKGRSDLGTVAAGFPQDGSVISRHLAILHEAGVVRRQKQGRHVFFELDGRHVLAQMEAITERCRQLAPLCCGSASTDGELPDESDTQGTGSQAGDNTGNAPGRAR